MSDKIIEMKPLRDKRILIIEDDVLILRVYSKWLATAGAEVVTANNGAQGIDVLNTQKVDLVLLDLGMPGLNGYDTLTLIRLKPEFETLPVIILSNTTLNAHDEQYADIRKAGVKDILRKYETSLKEIITCVSSYFPPIGDVPAH